MPHRRIHVPNRLRELYLTQVLQGFSFGLIGVFIPIYLLTLGFSIQQALLFFLVEKAVLAGASVLAASLNYRLGFKKTVILNVPFTAITYLLLFLLPTSRIHFLVPALTMGVGSALYWIPMNTLFMRHSDRRRRGTEVGFIQGMGTLIPAAAPALGGIIAASLGFPILVLIAMGMFIVSALPLTMSGDERATNAFRLKDLWKLRHHEMIGMTVADGFRFVAIGILFPLLIYVTLGSTESVGFIESLGTIVFAIVAILGGRLLDTGDRMQWLRISGAVFAAAVLAAMFLTQWWHFAAIIIVGAAMRAVYVTSYETLLLDDGNDLGELADEFIVVREIFLNMGRVAALGLAIIMPWQTGFAFAAIAMWISSLSLRAGRIAG